MNVKIEQINLLLPDGYIVKEDSNTGWYYLTDEYSNIIMQFSEEFVKDAAVDVTEFVLAKFKKLRK
jgi:hypothetical protein